MDLRCRLCADAKSGTEFACTIKDKYVNIQEMLRDCCNWTTFETSEYEDLPKLVCISCVDALKQCWQFSCSVARAQQQLLYDIQNQIDGTTSNIDFLAVAEPSESIEVRTVNKSETIDFLEQSWSYNGDDDDDGGGSKDMGDYHNEDDSEFEAKPPAEYVSRNPLEFADTATFCNDDSADEANTANDDEFNEMRSDFQLTQNLRDEERLPDGTIAPTAIQRLRLHDWSFVKNRCFVCKQLFGNFLSFKKHFETDHPNDKMKQVCMICDTILQTKYKRAQTRHITQVHLPYLKHW